MNHTRFEIFRGRDGQYYFRLKAGNGEIVCSSEGYSSKQACEKGIDVVRAIASSSVVIDLSILKES